MKLTDHIYLVGSSCIGLSAEGDCNVYALADGQELYLIDCGLCPDPDQLLKNMESDGLDPKMLRGVLLTHVHPDHAGAIPAFQNMGTPIFCSALSAQILAEGIEEFYRLKQRLPPSGFRDFLSGTPRGRGAQILEPGVLLPLGGCTLEMIPSPGHTPDSVCYLLRDGERKHLFTGDTLFYPGQINYFAPPLSCPEHYHSTIAALHALQPDGLFPGHALFAVQRGWKCTQQAMACLDAGILPPLKAYS